MNRLGVQQTLPLSKSAPSGVIGVALTPAFLTQPEAKRVLEQGDVSEAGRAIRLWTLQAPRAVLVGTTPWTSRLDGHKELTPPRSQPSRTVPQRAPGHNAPTGNYRL